ncbi:peptide chain release factor N(5)-glutamine methyltransferase [Flavobacterium selenitireducens]|uniref:peptide chain release factor N(5)-glutamine methyltransferase n=1 Tax=Flavobacterium selenitireducens TaxID=2722704 RepID=UPI00168A7979|nr:peptide chain release factor N(5)-glutamine methyltransferase [Flavobacterium selenitireducens]MBD3582735.1 peptide chain release factor N(5)-glutamine methyltransferase [Flavobacterium selenitireducens]
MLIRDFRQHFLSELAKLYDIVEAERFFYMLLEEYRLMKRIDLWLYPDSFFSDHELMVFSIALEKLKKHIPIQYILGKAHFYGLEFEVNPDVLVPRPETEELVDWIVKDYEFHPHPKLLDIGTGSGCIAISLAKNLKDAVVSAIDVSAAALTIATRNAHRNAVRVDFMETDILSDTELPRDLNVIVSNPPYVRHLEKAEMQANVLDHEPHLALFVEDDDALLFYRKIAELAIIALAPGGKLYFEINQYLADQTIDLLKSKGFSEIQMRKDLLGNDRMIKATKQ